jgi:hypothetical protein
VTVVVHENVVDDVDEVVGVLEVVLTDVVLDDEL